jgi:transcriptional regulator with XRE-family HTH domain
MHTGRYVKKNVEWAPLRNIIREKRERLGWSRLTLAVRSGVSESTIRYFELSADNRNPNLSSIYLIAQAFGISLAQLFKEAGYDTI